MSEKSLIDNTVPLKTEDFDHICRCCLSRNPKANIFQLKFHETFLVDIFKLFNTQVNWDDDLPKNICAPCTTTVINFYKFKKMYDNSVATLQNISRNSKEIVKKKALLLISYENDNILPLVDDVENEKIKVEEHEIMKEELGEELKNENNDIIKNKELLLATNQNHKDVPLREEVENENKNIKEDELVEESQNESSNQGNINDSINNAPTILEKTQKSDQTTISPRKGKHKFTLPYFCKICNKWVTATGPHKHPTPRKGSHVCDKCGKIYLKKGALQAHYRRIHKLTSLANGDNDEKGESDSITNDATDKQKKKFTYQCSCDETFRSCKDLIRHKKEKNHQDPLYKSCKICNKTIRYKGYKKHMRAAHSASSHEKSFACEYCESTFRSKDNLKRHIKIHTGEKPHVCEFCGKGYIQKNELENHRRRIHTGEKPFVCDFCGKGFVQKLLLEIHRRRMHTGERPFVCDFCGKGFVEKVLLMNHRRLHTGEKPYLCDNCGKTFRSSLTYNFHLKAKHQDKIADRMKLQCEICDVSYSSKKFLKRHMIQHDEDKKLVSSHCDNDFHTKHELDSHLITHTGGEKKFICNFCGKAFHRMITLRRHEYIHNAKKRYSCKICFKGFTQNAHLVSHMRIHTGEKPYTCPYCDKSFAHITTRLVHVRSHTGERPFVCDVCSKGFHHSSSMTKHRQSHFKNHLGTKKLQEST